MKKTGYFVGLTLLIAAAAFLAGSWQARRIAAPSYTNGKRVLYYHCPMHPQYTSDRPGNAPCCGMRLEPVYAGEAPADDGIATPPPGLVSISPDRQQRIGVQVGLVEKVGGSQTLRLFGRVAPDEGRVYKLIAGMDGLIRDISPVTTGSQVQKNQWLATYSAPDFRAPIQAFVFTLDSLDRLRQNNSNAAADLVRAAEESTRQAIDKLQNLGMSDLQVEQIRRTRQITQSIQIVAPASGFVLARNMSPAQRFDKGAEWYRIADLSRVWILADAFQNDAKQIRPGQSAQLRLSEGATLTARVSEVLPQFDSASRTLKVRLEAENPGFALRPDMFVDVQLPVASPEATAVPADAVLDSGLKKTVFVQRGEGWFEPRQVETGRRLGDRVEIVQGLEPGERIVVSGNFLLDSESRMKQVTAGPVENAGQDPVCGMRLNAGIARFQSEHDGQRHVFCSAQCKRQFDQHPEQFSVKAAGGNHRAGLKPASSVTM